MRDNEVTTPREDGRAPSAPPATPDARPEGVQRPSHERDTTQQVAAQPVIDQPPGDAQPPEVAGHDD